MPRLALLSLLFACGTVNAAVLNLRQSDSNGTLPVTIPQKDANAEGRKQEVAYRQENFLYNISQIGNAAAFPMGKLGEERVAMAWDQWQVDRNLITTEIQKDVAKIRQAIVAVGSTYKKTSWATAKLFDSTMEVWPAWTTTRLCFTRISGSTPHH